MSHAPITIHHTTSINVWPSLSLSTEVLCPMSKIHHSSSPIFLRNFACWPASYLIFAASYQKRNEKQNANANAVELIQCSKSMTVVILAAIPLWTEGNHHALRKEAILSFFAATRSMITLIIWMRHQTAIGKRNFGIIRTMI